MLCENITEKQEMRPIDNIVYKQIIKKFNDKYSDVLIEEQKTLFTKYILSYSDDNADLIVHLNEEISRIKNAVNNSSIAEKDKKQLIEKINDFKNKPIDKQLIEDVLSFQSLVKETQS